MPTSRLAPPTDRAPTLARRRAPRTVFLLAAITWGAACGDEGPAALLPPTATIELSGDSLLAVGAGTALGAVARDADGAPIPGAAVLWSSLDAHVARVSQAGWVTGLAPGVASIVGTSDAATDTVALRVFDPGMSPGEARGWIRDADGVRVVEWSSWADAFDVMGGDEGDHARIGAGRFALPGVPDSTALVVWSSSLGEGTYPIHDYPLTGGEAPGPVVSFTAGTAGVDLEVFLSVGGGEMTLGPLAYPARPGLLPGEARGRLHFRAARYAVGPGGEPVATGDTVEVYVDLYARLQHYLRSRMSVSFDGGPVIGSTGLATAQTYLEAGRLEAWWDSDFDGVPGQAWAFEAQQAFVLEAAATGSHAIEAITPVEYVDTGLWPTLFSVIHYRDDARVALSRGGTVTLTRFVIPTSEYYGEVEGTIDTELELWDADGTATGELFGATASFAIPINPIGAAPPAPPTGAVSQAPQSLPRGAGAPPR